MKILFLTMLRVNSFSERNIYTDLMREFIENGHSVTLLCPQERRYDTREVCIKEQENQIIQIPTGNLFQTNIIEKGISTLLLESAFIRGIKRHVGKEKIDLVLYSTPPITFARAIQYVKKNNGAKSYLLLKDIFPQNAVDLHMFHEKGLLHRFFRQKEKKLYQLSDYIGCMSEENCYYLTKHNPMIKKELVEVCPNTITPVEEERISEESRKIFRQELFENLRLPSNTVVFLYGGNFGKPQGAEYIMQCLERYKDREDTAFLLCGKGTEYGRLQGWLQDKQIENVRLIPWLDSERYRILVQCSDVGLVFLNKDFTIPNFPSRLLSYLEAGLPVVAATDKNTDLGRVIVEGGFGLWCESRQAEDFEKVVEKLIPDEKLRQMMGECGRQFLKENWTSEKAYEIIMKHFR